MMNRFFTLLLAASCLTAVGQVTYPYNPDEDGNGQIAVGDLQGILATYGNEFSPSEILVNGETLTTVLTQLQNSIDSLSGLTGGGGSVLDMPLGTVLPIATESVPEGWMLCDGREIAIEEYQGLYDLIGTTYGAGDSAFWAQVFFPATTFNIPDLRGRTIIGVNDMGGEQSEVIVNHSAQRGQIGGAEMHQLVESELPVVSFPVLSFQSAGPDLVNNGSIPVAETQFQFGADEPHNNMQPYMALNYMMKVRASEDLISQINASLDSLSTSVNSIAALTNFSLSCVDMGVGEFCDEGTGFGSYQIEPLDGYRYPVSHSCNCYAVDNEVAVNWRRMRLTGTGVGSYGKVFLKGGRYNENSGNNQIMTGAIEALPIDNDNIEFYVYAVYYNQWGGCPNPQFGGLPAGVDSSNGIAVRSDANGGYASNWTNAEIMIPSTNGGLISTGITIAFQ